jgi:hypothetical protein
VGEGGGGGGGGGRAHETPLCACNKCLLGALMGGSRCSAGTATCRMLLRMCLYTCYVCVYIRCMWLFCRYSYVSHAATYVSSCMCLYVSHAALYLSSCM